MLKTSPAVFAVANTYQIMALVNAECLFWVRVGDTCYYDEQNGVMRSASEVHRVTVPMTALDATGGYTVCVRPIVERKPYFTQTAATQEYVFSFKPIPADNIRAYHLADAHGRIDEPIAAARAFGNIDLLILNGDIVSFNDSPEDCHHTFLIADALTHGGIPIVYTRGNHDLRGYYAEHRAAYTPLANGKPYYTVRLGSLWCVILDCAEDKPDDHAEYGGTVCCHAFRETQTAFLQDIIARKEYEAEGITTRLVLSHNPFTRVKHPPFDIETEIYAEWARLLREHVHPDLMLCGHVHTTEVHPVGGDFDHLGQPCTVVTASKPDDGYFAGAGVVFADNGITVSFTDSDGAVLEEHSL